MENEKILNDDFLDYLSRIRYMTRTMLDKHNDVNDAGVHAYYLGQYDVINAVISNYVSYLEGKENNENE